MAAVALYVLLYFSSNLVFSSESSEKKARELIESLATNATVQKEAYAPGEKILLQLTIKNISQKDITLRKYPPLGLFNIVVTLPNGKKAPPTLYGNQLSMLSPFASNSIVLSPKKEYTKTIDINRYFDMTMPGKYGISVNLRTSLGNDNRNPAPAQFISLQITE